VAAAKASPAGYDAEAMCVCNKCLDNSSACHDDDGCASVNACALREGCHGINGCYWGKGPCKEEILAVGLSSLSVALFEQLADCAANMSCTANSAGSCKVGSFECDGNEDCGSDGMCCAHYESGRYDGSRCQSSCEALNKSDAGPAGESWAELCHPGDSCSEPGYSCLASEYLPSFLYRCRNIGAMPVGPAPGAPEQVSCGDASCGKGEKCCTRDPKAPYCAPVDQDCACEAKPAKDAGAGGTGGGGDDGGADGG
jgi:hypothetical protein